MYQTLVVSGTVQSQPEVLDNGHLNFLMTAFRKYKVGDQLKSVDVWFDVVVDPKMCPTELKEGNRIIFKGEISGEEKWGGPVIKKDPDTGGLYTTIDAIAQFVNVQPAAPKNVKPVDVIALTIVGNLGKEPQMKFSGDGNPYTYGSIATNRSELVDGQWVNYTTWFQFTAFKKAAEKIAELAKGSKLLIEGSIEVDDEMGGPKIWGDPGQEKTNYKIVVHKYRTFEKAAYGEAPPSQEEDEIPF